MLFYYNIRSPRYTDVPAYSQVFLSELLRKVATKAECLYDFVPLTEPALNPHSGSLGIPSSLNVTGDYPLRT